MALAKKCIKYGTRGSELYPLSTGWDPQGRCEFHEGLAVAYFILADTEKEEEHLNEAAKHGKLSKLGAMMRDKLPQLKSELTEARNAAERAQEKKSGCFIATAAFDDAFAPEVLALQTFRDEVISQTVLGRAFIRIYYFVSPFVATLVSRSKLLKAVSRVSLTHLVVLLQPRK